MTNLQASVAVGSLLLATGVAVIATPFILSGLANDNVLYTKVPEGTGKVIVKGHSFHRAILSFKGHHLNDPGKKDTFDGAEPEWEVLENKPGKNYDDRPALTRGFGLYLVGIPGMRSVYEYNFVWNEYRTKKDGNPEVWHRDEQTELFMANDFPYVMVVEDAKTKDNLPVRAEFVIIVRITNPFKALFHSNDWRTQLESYVDRQARNFIGTYTYDELRSETDEGRACREENFSKPIQRLTHSLPEEEECDVDPALRKGTKGAIGITVKAANLESIVLSGPAAVKNEELSIAAYTADRHADVTRKGAEADAFAIRQAADADAYAIEKKADAKAHEIDVTAKADAGGITVRLEAMAKNPELSTTMMVTDALQNPGEGKTIVDISSVLERVGAHFVSPKP